jgi:hypothetical protein
MHTDSSISQVVVWLEERGYYVEFDKSGDDSVDRIAKVVSINTTRSEETQLYIILHECGHILVAESDIIVNGIDEVLEKYSYSSKIYKTFTVIEEVEAWKRGLALARRLKIPINKKKWNRDVSRAIYKYMLWATGQL